jgi:DNA polymerase sigma
MEFGIMKVCSKCGEVKFLNEFNKQKGAKYDRRCACKECLRNERSQKPRTEYHAQYYIENKDEINEQHKIYYAEHKEEFARRHAEYNKTEAGKIANRKHTHKRRGFGCEPLNEYFEGSHFHHLHIDGDNAIGIYIPKELHMSIPHNSFTGDGMQEINELAIKYLNGEI